MSDDDIPGNFEKIAQPPKIQDVQSPPHPNGTPLHLIDPSNGIISDYSQLQRHSPVASIFKCNIFSYSSTVQY